MSEKIKIPESANAKAAEAGLELMRDEQGRLTLTDGRLMLCAELGESLRRLRADNLGRELLVRAARIKHREDTGSLRAIDATAGLGEDSLLLAAAGFEVTLFEYDTIIAALLGDALERAKKSNSELLKKAAEHMQLVNGDSIEEMKRIGSSLNAAGTEKMYERPDVILLDPMFPAREKSALIKKKFQLLQRLECPCGDEAGLLEAAVLAHPRKIVIKRPLKGPFLAGRRPDYSIKGKAIRYDCIVMA